MSAPITQEQLEEWKALAESVNIGPSDLMTAAKAVIPLVSEVERLREALTKAAEQFEFYAREHRAKAAALPGQATDDPAYLAAHAKADTNERFAEMCRAALTQEQ